MITEQQIGSITIINKMKMRRTPKPGGFVPASSWVGAACGSPRNILYPIIFKMPSSALASICPGAEALPALAKVIALPKI